MTQLGLTEKGVIYPSDSGDLYAGLVGTYPGVPATRR